MDAREQKGLQIAILSKIEKNRLGWKVPSQSGNGSYIVNLDHGQPFCTCPDFEKGNKCKHIHAIEFRAQRESKVDGTTTLTQSIKLTCTQEWLAYNAAQTNEQDKFVTLLRDLCHGIPQPAQGFGRPRLPLSDVMFGVTFKVYTMMSGRRFMSDIRDAQTKGLVTKSPSFTSTFRYLENPELTPLLKSLIEHSAMPLRAIETNFAVDSSGFATSVYDRWYDDKYGKERSEHHWVKAHLTCGVKTHVVTSVEVTPTETADAPQFAPLVAITARNFSISEVSADKAYSSRKNLKAAQAVGATAYIPFKERTTGIGNSFDGLWNRMWHYYNFNRATFMEHYHKRSNIETAYSMIKAKFGGSIRSKTPVAQINEVLCKVLCHNICVLIQSIYELGIEPVFSLPTFGTKGVVVPKVGS